MRTQHPRQHQCGIFTNNADPIIGFSSAVESPQSELRTRGSGSYEVQNTGPCLYAGNRASDAGGGIKSSFIVFMCAHGQPLAQATAVSLAHIMATPNRTASVSGYIGTHVVFVNGLHKFPTKRTSYELPII